MTEIIKRYPWIERELTEEQKFRDFLITKNGMMVFNLKGHDNIK